MNTVSRVVIALGLAAFVTVASAADMLTGKNGMTLYTFDKDSAGKSACTGQCSALWPAAQPGDAAGADFGTIARDDGSKQLTYKDKPVYYFVQDTKPGDAKGDGMKDVWHVIAIGAKKNSSASGYNYSAYSY